MSHHLDSPLARNSALSDGLTKHHAVGTPRDELPCVAVAAERAAGRSA